MSWLSHATGIHVGSKQLGSLLGTALGIPFGPMGMAIGSGLGRAGGGMISGEKPGQALLHGAVAGAGAYGVGKILPHIPGASHIPGVGDGGAEGVAGAAGGVAAPPPPGNYGNLFQNDVIDPMAARLGSGGGGFSPGSIASSVGSFAKTNAAPLIQAGGGALSSISGAQQQAANRELQQKEFDFQKQQTLRQNQLEDEQRQRQQGVSGQWLQGMANSNPQNPQVMAILRAMGYA